MPKYTLQKINAKTGKVKEKELKASTWTEAHEKEVEKASGWSEKYFSHVKEQ